MIFGSVMKPRKKKIKIAHALMQILKYNIAF